MHLAVFGCPTKKLVKKINELKPSVAVKVVVKRNQELKQTLNAPQVGPGPSDRKKPVVINQLPKPPKVPESPPRVAPKTSIRPPKIDKQKKEKFKNLVADRSKSSIKKAIKLLGNTVSETQKRILRNLLKKGKTAEEIKKEALKKIKEALEKLKKKKQKEEVKKTAQPPKITTIKKLTEVVKKSPWVAKVQQIVKNGGSFTQVKKVLQKNGFNRAPSTFWNKVQKSVQTGKVSNVVRAVVRPVAPYIPPVRYVAPRPAQPVRKWVLRYHSYLTYYWGGYWSYTWKTYCHCCRRWWWSGCNCWWGRSARYISYPVYYWRTYSYWVYQ